MVEGWQGSGYRTRTAFGDTFVGNAAQVSTPRVHRCTFFSIGRAIWFLAFVANSTSGITEPKLPVTSATLRRPHQSLAGGRAGRRICANFGPTGAFQSRSRVSTWLLFISKGEYVFLFRREQCLRPTGFRPAVADATCCSFGGHASPEDARMGRRIGEFRFVFVSIPAARSGHCSYRCGYTTFVLPS